MTSSRRTDRRRSSVSGSAGRTSPSASACGRRERPLPWPDVRRGDMSDTPASLLQRLRQPDSRQAWERFVDLYTPLIFFWGVRAGLPAQDAGDLVQDVFATLLTKLPEFDYDRDRSFRAWLRTITLNRWRDLRRRQAVRAHAGSEALEHVAAPEAAEALWEAEYRRYVAGRAV